MKYAYKILVGNVKGGDQLGNMGIDRVQCYNVCKSNYMGMEWIHLAQDNDQRQVIFKRIMKCLV
jgi:hypothetical protein